MYNPHTLIEILFEILLKDSLHWRHCEAARSFFRAMHSVHLSQCGTVKLRLPAVRELFWGMLGRGDGGLRGIGVSGSGYNEVLALEVLNVV